MKLLVLGGTRFLSRETATQAVARGWDVTCACRGESGPVPDGATHLPWDRSDAPPAALVDGGWDAVIDVTRLPSHARTAVAAVPDAHWVFVSTISVYTDNASSAMEPLAEPITEDVDLAVEPDAYGGMKVACEQAVQELAASCVITRPGLIVGPGDPTGRFAYWPQRLARGGEVLAPGRPDDVVQVIDVRDLATWLLDLAGSRTTGVLDAVGTPMPFAAMLAGLAAGLGTEPRADLGRPGLPRGPRRPPVGGRGLAAAVAPAPGVRRHAGARPRPGRGGRAAAAYARRDRPRLPRLARVRAQRGARGRAARGLALPLTVRVGS